jgi:hypothetical protein
MTVKSYHEQNRASDGYRSGSVVLNLAAHRFSTAVIAVRDALADLLTAPGFVLADEAPHLSGAGPRQRTAPGIGAKRGPSVPA